jgi:hypothetical protein
VLKDGTSPKEIYASPDLIRAYVDQTAMLVVEATADTTDATLRVIPSTPAAEGATAEFPDFPAADEQAGLLDVLGRGDGRSVATNFNAAGTRVFASDETSFYLLADTANGDALVQVSKENPAAQTTLASSPNVITNAQLANGALWYVRDGNRIFKLTLPDEANGVVPGEPTEVFGIAYASCSLAVGADAAFCSVGSGVERRDLSGANPTTILDAQRSVTGARFGAAMAEGGTLFVRSDAPDAKVKHVIRVVKAGPGGAADERLAACGRSLVTDMAIDATNVVWTEQDGGVFIATR